MTDSLDDVTPASTKQKGQPKRTVEQEAERAAIRALVKAAKGRGEDLTGPDALLRVITKTVLEAALDEEMTDHLGYDKHDPDGYGSGNSRNGTRSKTVLTDNAGPITTEVPRDRTGTFEPVIVPKRARRLGDVDTIVLSLFAKGLTTCEISAHFAEIYGRRYQRRRSRGSLTGSSTSWSCGGRDRCSRSTSRCSSTRSW